MVWYSCQYCSTKFLSFENVVSHLCEDHGNSHIKFTKQTDNTSKQFIFKIIPEMCREQGRIMSIKPDEEKIHLSRANVVPKDSPCSKLLKVQNDNDIAESEDAISSCCGSEDDGDAVYTELISLLPSVINELNRVGKIEEFVSFHRLVSDGKFPLGNIAFLLFLDVVRWYGIESSSSSMKYSPEIKLFWKTGLRLFHGRFLKFMSGPKCTGQRNVSSMSDVPSTANSAVNFIVPDRKMLQDEKTFVNEHTPGILKSMISTIAECDPDQSKTYKLCVDGKKINPSSKGEVRLWGYEDPPTFDEKQARLSTEKALFEDLSERIEKLSGYGHTNISTCDNNDREYFYEGFTKSVQVISKRIRDLRQLKVKKEIFLRKLIAKCESDWRNSQFSMVISSIKTTIYKIENCIDEMLHCNDLLCEYAAIIGGGSLFLHPEKQTPLANQGNYVCLSNTEKTNDTSLIKQRSDIWFQKRKESAVTGSTICTAIGLDGLKRQKEHLEMKAGKQPEREVTTDLQKMLDHGAKNEINAIATLVTTFLPAFSPSTSFFEEGCYIEKEGHKSVLVVSPDGSIRQMDDEKNILHAVEIKCPYPGKIFTTPVHYKLPHYYVPQVLSEMHSLRVNTLLFLSYSDESMTVHKVNMEKSLWEDIFKEIKVIDINNIPRKLSMSATALKPRLVEFCESRVELLAEVSSRVAISCDHSASVDIGRIHHESPQGYTHHQVQLKDIHKIQLKITELITECHSICMQRASEVLVFLVADLDRTYKAEIPHAFPVAFALKGYSMKTGAMRKMLQDVLAELFVQGLYVPAISYDGQWAKLAFQNEDGEPLTMLELQKKVSSEVQKRSIKVICDMIFQVGLVKATSWDDVAKELHILRRHSGITVGLGRSQRLFRMTSNMVSWIYECRQRKTTEYERGNEENVDEVLSNVPAEVLTKLDDSTFQTLASIDKSTDSITPDQTDVELSQVHALTVTGSVHCAVIDEVPMSVEDDDDATSVLGGSSHIESQGSLASSSDHTLMPNVINSDYLKQALEGLQQGKEWSSKWDGKSVTEFTEIMSRKDLLSKMTKSELLFCYSVLKNIKDYADLKIYKSWNKAKIVDVLYSACTLGSITALPVKRRFKNPQSLICLCRKAVRSLPKKVLNAIVSEYEFANRVKVWQETSPYKTPTAVEGIGDVVWFSKPEFNESNFSFVFSFLDPHHLLTNCRIKVCKDGFPQRGIHKKAWMDVARGNKTNLKISHVEDLVDRQSDSIAMATFSVDVEEAMLEFNHTKEAAFCRLVREFHEAEDAPGISALERCQRRLNLREWLLEGVNFGKFPAYGSHIRGIPNVMFQGYLTNIDRRIQLYPYVKSGKYNVRSLGSLEAENFFGEFQDLDPKGSGVIKTEDIPSALEAACQMNHTRLMPNRPFYMTLSKAKVYPINELLPMDSENQQTGPNISPVFTSQLSVRDHMFDNVVRAKRKAKRRLVTISAPDSAARGVAPVRQHHKCDESKILPHKRLGIELD